MPDKGASLLLEAVKQNASHETISLLLDNGADPTRLPNQGASLLLYTLKQHDERWKQISQRIVKQSPNALNTIDLNTVSDKGASLLLYAVEQQTTDQENTAQWKQIAQKIAQKSPQAAAQALLRFNWSLEKTDIIKTLWSLTSTYDLETARLILFNAINIPHVNSEQIDDNQKQTFNKIIQDVINKHPKAWHNLRLSFLIFLIDNDFIKLDNIDAERKQHFFSESLRCARVQFAKELLATNPTLIDAKLTKINEKIKANDADDADDAESILTEIKTLIQVDPRIILTNNSQAFTLLGYIQRCQASSDPKIKALANEVNATIKKAQDELNTKQTHFTQLVKDQKFDEILKLIEEYPALATQIHLWNCLTQDSNFQKLSQTTMGFNSFS